MATDAASPARPISLRSQVRTFTSSPMAPYYFIITSVTVLVALGSLMVLSASSTLGLASKEYGAYYFITRQLMFLAVGVCAAAVLSRLSPELLRRWAWGIWALALVCLTLPFTPLGVEVAGNLAWVDLGPIRFQPSELSKLALVVWSAAMLHLKRNKLHDPLQLAIPFVPGAGLLLALVLASRDLGTGIVIALTLVLLMWFVGTPLRVLAPLSLAAAVVLVLMVVGSGNRSSRIAVFLDPASNPDLASQPMAGLYALASGGWWGLGLGASKQKWGGLKTAAHTDYIFAVLGEELGLVGVLLVIALFALLAAGGIMVALRSDTVFARLTAAGITGWFLTQAIVNIFVVLNLLPVLGVPLPFLSYGGSALLASLMAVGVLLMLARNTPDAKKYLAARKSKGRTRMTSVLAAGRKDG